MTTSSSLKDNLEKSKYLIFYKIMNYPIPRNSEYFLFEKKLDDVNIDLSELNNEFSRNEKSPFMDEYVSFINKFSWLYKSIPFIQSIYICNSLTFNCVKNDSDIDLFIITKKWSLWLARLFSLLLFSLLFVKRRWKNKRKKFCLSFYTTQDNQNLYNITLPQNDIYFTYRLAHLIPIYQESEENIYKYNKWLNSLLPNFPWNHIINIWTKKVEGKSTFKNVMEFLFWWISGRVVELTIKTIRLPIVIYKTIKLKEKWRWIIVSDHMLKFHLDARKKIHLLYEIQKKRSK